VRRSPDTGTKILGTACGVLLTAPVGLPHAYPLELEAVLEADPRQGKDGRDFAPHWIIAHADEELAAYHRRLISDRLGVRLAKPSFGAHV